jgi:integrase
MATRLADRSDLYKEQFKASLERDVYKVIGDKDVKTVTSADVLKVMRDTIKHVQKQNNFGTGEVAALNNRKYIGGVIRYAIATLRADYDPTYAVKNAIERPTVEHARPLEKHEMVALRTSLENYTGTETVKNAGLTLLYSMLRTVEVRRMQWSYVDFEDKTITYPIASRKTGQQRTTKKNRIHIVPMSDQLYELLKQQHEKTGSHLYVFSGIRPTSMLGEDTINGMLRRMGLNGVTAHDFRATASTLLNEKGYEEDWIEKQLAHADDNKNKGFI